MFLLLIVSRFSLKDCALDENVQLPAETTIPPEASSLPEHAARSPAARYHAREILRALALAVHCRESWAGAACLAFPTSLTAVILVQTVSKGNPVIRVQLGEPA